MHNWRKQRRSIIVWILITSRNVLSGDTMTIPNNCVPNIAFKSGITEHFDVAKIWGYTCPKNLTKSAGRPTHKQHLQTNIAKRPNNNNNNNNNNLIMCTQLLTMQNALQQSVRCNYHLRRVEDAKIRTRLKVRLYVHFVACWAFANFTLLTPCLFLK
jgi:hypothetical protein